MQLMVMKRSVIMCAIHGARCTVGAWSANKKLRIDDFRIAGHQGFAHLRMQRPTVGKPGHLVTLLSAPSSALCATLFAPECTLR